MLKDIKLIVFDIDGTVLGKGPEGISKRTIKALEDAYAGGITLAIASGRAISMIPEEVINIKGVQHLISSSGAVLTDLRTNSTVYRKEMQPDTVLSLMELASQHGISFSLCFQDNGLFEEKTLLKYEKSGEADYESIENYRRKITVVESAPDYIASSRCAVEKLSCMQDGSFSWDEFLEELREFRELEVVVASKYEIEITHRGINKGFGLNKLEETLDLKKENVMVFGDSGNDISMKEYSGCFVAMGNSDKCVFDYADYVTETVENDGVAVFLEKHINLDSGVSI